MNRTLSLKETLFKRNLTDEELQTALVSAEGMVNQRPLSYVGADEEEFVLTPNHFLHGNLGGLLASTKGTGRNPYLPEEMEMCAGPAEGDMVQMAARMGNGVE